MPMTDTARFTSAMTPVWTNNGASEGMSPCTFLTGTQWQAWNGRLAVGMLSGQRIDILQLNGTSIATGSTASLPSARMRALVQGPDGNLYIATDGGEIWQVVPQ